MNAAETPSERRYPAGRLRQLHVHQQRLRAGKPALIVREGGRSGSVYWSTVEVLGPSRMVQPGRALSCGARAWIETSAEVVARRAPDQNG